jgi:hypothetical protein
MPRRQNGAVGGERVIGLRVPPPMEKWLALRSKETGRSLSQLIRVCVEHAMKEGWTFGGPPTPDAARKAGGA